MKYLKQEDLDKLSARSLPITGGDGRTQETAYQLVKIKQFEAPSVENLIIDLTLKASGYLFWLLKNQTFTIEEEQEIDCLRVNAMKNGEIREFSFYFDLTELA